MGPRARLRALPDEGDDDGGDDREGGDDVDEGDDRDGGDLDEDDGHI